jgi:hypothetical protein
MSDLLKEPVIKKVLDNDIDLKEHIKSVEQTLLHHEQESLQDCKKSM